MSGSVLMAVMAAAMLGQSKPAHKLTLADLMQRQQDLMSEMSQQRQMLIQLLQAERARNDALTKALQQLGGGHGGAVVSTPPVIPEVKEPKDTGGITRTVSLEPRPVKRKAPAPAAERASLSGQVRLKTGRATDVYVYLEDVRGPMVRGQSLEIQQKDKQFSPRVAVVQRGTTLTFPNYDAVFHNVFSLSPGNSFDLGTYQAGDQARTVKVTQPGVVDIFCNMHSRMSASVLVVPSNLYAKVQPDGRFQIDNVPLGKHRLVAWSPSGKPVTQEVTVSQGGTETTLSLEVAEKQTHTNKYGAPYGSYGD